jgi:hypothetical protein
VEKDPFKEGEAEEEVDLVVVLVGNKDSLV